MGTASRILALEGALVGSGLNMGKSKQALVSKNELVESLKGGKW